MSKVIQPKAVLRPEARSCPRLRHHNLPNTTASPSKGTSDPPGGRNVRLSPRRWWLSSTTHQTDTLLLNRHPKRTLWRLENKSRQWLGIRIASVAPTRGHIQIHSEALTKKRKKLNLQYLYIFLRLKNGICCLSEIQLKLDIPYCIWQTYWGRQGWAEGPAKACLAGCHLFKQTSTNRQDQGKTDSLLLYRFTLGEKRKQLSPQLSDDLKQNESCGLAQ